MPDSNQIKLLMEGVGVWNKWRSENPQVEVNLIEGDLSSTYLYRANLRNANLRGAKLTKTNLSNADLDHADLSGANLSGAYLSECNLSGADLSECNLAGAELLGAYLIRAKLTGAILCDANIIDAELTGASLIGADLTRAKLNGANLLTANLSGAMLKQTDLSGASLCGTNLTQAILTEAVLFGANLTQTIITGADLSGVNLQQATLIKTNLDQATLIGCKIFGLSAWALKGVPKEQSRLIITPDGEAEITVDDLQVAQFIYLLLNNQNVRNVIDTITSKAVLILGRFTDEREAVLDALHTELRKSNYLPILFDFNGPENRDITETVSTLAHMARFVIADITDAKSIPQELERIVPGLPSVPVQPILLSSQKEYGMFGHYKRYPWVLETYHYEDLNDVVNSISAKIIEPLELKFSEQNLTIK